MLRSGLHEIARQRPLRHLVLIVSLLAGVLAFDEYFAFVAREHGALTQTVPLLVALISMGQAIGTALAVPPVASVPCVTSVWRMHLRAAR